MCSYHRCDYVVRKEWNIRGNEMGDGNGTNVDIKASSDMGIIFFFSCNSTYKTLAGVLSLID